MRLLPASIRDRLRRWACPEGDPYRPSPDEFIPSMAIERYLEGKTRVLVVGDAMGREWTLLSRLGKQVAVVDVVPLPDAPNFVQQSITERTPFADQWFDGVVLAEVLEHLFEDHAALREVRRILKDDGILVITVPYLSNRQDEAPYHVRAHSRRTIDRLLAYCGFRIQEHFYRGLVSRLPQRALTARCCVLLPRLMLNLLFGAAGLRWYRRCCYGLERWMGSGRLLCRIQKHFASYGGILKAVKAEPVDFAAIQVAEFSGKLPASTGE